MKPPIKIFYCEGAMSVSTVRMHHKQGEYILLDSIYTCPECLDSGGVTSHYVGDYKKIIKDCPCLKNPNSIASIKRGGSDNAK